MFNQIFSKMKKKFKKCIFVVAALISLLSITSCSSNNKDDDNNLKGYWVSPIKGYVMAGGPSIPLAGQYVEFLHFYEFVNGNTVRVGSFESVPDPEMEEFSQPFVTIDGKDWYIWEKDYCKTYTYSYSDGKVLILKLGDIFTISGNTMIPDGSTDSDVYTKAKNVKKH